MPKGRRRPWRISPKQNADTQRLTNRPECQGEMLLNHVSMNTRRDFVEKHKLISGWNENVIYEKTITKPIQCNEGEGGSSPCSWVHLVDVFRTYAQQRIYNQDACATFWWKQSRAKFWYHLSRMQKATRESRGGLWTRSSQNDVDNDKVGPLFDMSSVTQQLLRQCTSELCIWSVQMYIRSVLRSELYIRSVHMERYYPTWIKPNVFGLITYWCAHKMLNTHWSPSAPNIQT